MTHEILYLPFMINHACINVNISHLKKLGMLPWFENLKPGGIFPILGQNGKK